MAELRWNPMIQDWVIIASHRQNRSNMPKDWCPFCPGKDKKVPEDYDVYDYNNDFPALSQNPPPPDAPLFGETASDIYKAAPSYGKCEVILFSPDHYGRLCDLSVAHIRRIVDLWSNRFNAMAADPKIKYVFIFENRGEMVGVTMPHPHGQIYGYSKLPKKIELELYSAREFYDKEGKCLFCRINEEEKSFGERIVAENDSFITYVPFFADYAYGTYVSCKSHKKNITEFTDKERNDLADMIKKITGAYDHLFANVHSFPYMMCMHNAPVNTEGIGDIDSYFHWHIEFYPTMRDSQRQQFMASSETGVWAHCNPTVPEEKAAELREALERFEDISNQN